jgi:hypothetical protein
LISTGTPTFVCAFRNNPFRLRDLGPNQPSGSSTITRCFFGQNVACRSDSDLGPRLSLVRSSLNNGHAATTAPCPKSATFGLMHCGITSSACAGNTAHRLSRRGGPGGVPRRPRRGACAHHRVGRSDRDARHEARSTRSRATRSTKPPPTAAPREPARRQSAGRRRRPCTEAIAGVLRRVPRITAGYARHRELELRRLRHALRGVPIRILQLSPAAHLLSPDDAVDRISTSRSRAFGDLIVERESICK